MSQYHWDWQVFTRISDDDRMYWELLWEGAQQTVIIAILAFIVAFTLGSLLGTLRTLNPEASPFNKWAVKLSDMYVEFFRNIPLIVQLFLWFHVLPEIVPQSVGNYLKQDLQPWVLGFIGLGLFTSSRIAEQVKAGLNTISRGQMMAGLALGLTTFQTYFYVRLPMAYRVALPTLTSEAMNVFKNSSVTFVVGVLETFFQAKQMIEKTSQEYEVLIVVALIYMSFALTAYAIAHKIEDKLRLPGMIGEKQ